MRKTGGLLLLVAGTLLPACSTTQVAQVVLSRDPVRALESIATRRVSSYKYNPTLLIADVVRVRKEYNRLLGRLRKESGAKWGKREAGTLPTRTRYVKYTDGYSNRVVVDYDEGTILIEHLDGPGVKEKLRDAAVMALLTPGDPAAVDLFSDREIEMTGKPYLLGMVADQYGNLIASREDAERYADYLVERKLRRRSIDVDGATRDVLYVDMRMVNTHMDKRALQYADMVRRHAETNQLSRSLVYAIIRIESAFNPYAVSSAPAYGMMQLVPASGGREAYRKAKGKDVVPSKEYLFDADNNIELGSTYLGILFDDSPLNRIADPVSREYCVIAAYNTGPNNVYRAFSSLKGAARQEDALARINAMRPDEVYETLRARLPYKETRGYIVKALEAKRRYAAM